MRSIVFGFAIAAALFVCAGEGICSDRGRWAKDSGKFANPAFRAEKVGELADGSREAKAAAQRKAAMFGWQLSGRAKRGIFELMRLKNGMPLYRITNNIDAAISTGANFVRNTAPFNVNGGGLTVGIWDGGAVSASHQEFGSRVTVMDGASSFYHATHVGGTIGAAGVDPQALGMAPSVSIDSYEWTSDTSEMADRAASYPDETGKIYLSNHSYGIVTGWDTGSYSGNYGPHWFGVRGDREDEGFGQYGYDAATWDSICCSAPYYLPFKSAGNDRNDKAPADGATFYYYLGTWHSKIYDSNTGPYDDGWDNGGFDTIAYEGNAKNIMTVGAVSDAVQAGLRSVSAATMASFSTWGPTDDGRIKPDIVANGIGLYSCTNSSDSSYASYSGTSMSAPDAAGGAVLLIAYYNRLFPGQAMRASTLKGLIIHTADDMGNAGPDYSFGWGLMNVKAAAEQIKDHNEYPPAYKIVEGLLDAGNPNDSYSFVWDGNSPVRATLCWTDPAAAALRDIDNPSPRLINDLDLRIVAPGGLTTYYPYVLDPLNPANPAATDDNILDNVEQVDMASPNTPGIYTVQVSHKGTLADGRQYYSLIISGQHAVPPAAGTVTLDDELYSCSDILAIEVEDGDLAWTGSATVVLTTSGLDSETVLLDEDPMSPGVFAGTIATSPNAVSVEDGMLEAGHGDVITATYEDSDDGTGNPAQVTDTATTDCQGPVILNIEVANITSNAATVVFETNEPASASVGYGLSCGGPNAVTIAGPMPQTSHSFQLGGLVPETDYYFELAAADEVNNVTIEDNAGACYQFTTTLRPAEIYVPDDYNTIQQAVDSAVDGNVIIVADGLYSGPNNRDIDFGGKAITVISENGPANCIIDCEGIGRAFYFHSGEARNSIVSGFTITNGQAFEGGAIYCKSSSPTIAGCYLKLNSADYGGGLYMEDCCSPGPLLKNCIVSQNSAAYFGGAVCCSGSWLSIGNCTFSINSAGNEGGAIAGYYNSSVDVSNSILWGNTAEAEAEIALYGLSNPSSIQLSYCDVKGGAEEALVSENCLLLWGPGGISAEPDFVDANAADYHLRSSAGHWQTNTAGWVSDAWTSPCVDAGNPGCALGDEPGDANNVRINIGAYGGTAEASRSPAGWASRSDLTNDRVVDTGDTAVFAEYWLTGGECLAGDIDRSGYVDSADFAAFAADWHWQRQ